MRWLMINIVFCCVGCLEQPAAPVFDSEPISETDRTPTEIAPLVPQADPAFTPPAPDPPGYTGAIVYCAAGCKPCGLLVDDLDWFCEKYGWSIQSGDSSTAQADWVISHTGSQPAYPVIEYYVRGSPVDRIEGYSTAPWESRRALLRQIIDSHPVQRRKDGQQNQTPSQTPSGEPSE